MGRARDWNMKKRHTHTRTNKPNVSRKKQKIERTETEEELFEKIRQN